MRVGPTYHGVLALRSVTLSPTSADNGIVTTSSSPISAAKAR